MNVPITNQMNGVFVHVSDLKESAKWYADLLGLSIELEKIVSPVFNLPVQGTVSLTLDDHTFDPSFKWVAGTGPLFNLFAPDIEIAYKYVREKGIEIVREKETAEDLSWFNIKDPDGNVIMICDG